MSNENSSTAVDRGQQQEHDSSVSESTYLLQAEDWERAATAASAVVLPQDRVGATGATTVAVEDSVNDATAISIPTRKPKHFLHFVVAAVVVALLCWRVLLERPQLTAYPFH